MNIDRMKAETLKHKMQTEAALNGEGIHAQHINDYCEYADAAAEAAAKGVLNELPKSIQQEVTKQLSKQKVSVEVDRQSLKKAKDAIQSLFASIGRLGR